MICERRVIRRSDDWWSSGASDGSICHVSSRMFGGGRQKDKKSKAEMPVWQVFKNAEGLKSGDSGVRQAHTVTRMIAGNEGYLLNTCPK